MPWVSNMGLSYVRKRQMREEPRPRGICDRAYLAFFPHLSYCCLLDVTISSISTFYCKGALPFEAGVQRVQYPPTTSLLLRKERESRSAEGAAL